MKTQLILISLVGGIGLSATGCVDRQAQQQAKRTEATVSNPVRLVQVVSPSTQVLARTVDLTGQIATTEDSQVGAKASGKLIEVNVKDSDSVSAGQVIARQDTTQLLAQLSQANAQLMTAEASYQSANSQLAQAIRNAAINPSKSRAGVMQAQAQLRSAKANLSKVTTGARPQERIQAQSSVRSAKANLDTQQKQLQRIRTLVNQGALAGSQLDIQQAAYETAQSQYTNALEALRLIQAGNRSEDVQAAREQVQVAEEGVRTAQATQQLDPILQDQVNSARAQVSSAQAQIQTAKSQIAIARQALEDAVIRAPFSGRVSGQPAQVGQIVGAGTPVARIVGNSGNYFEADVPEDQVSMVIPGKPVQIRIDALNTTLPGSIVAVRPSSTSVGRQYAARVAFGRMTAGLRPGMFGKATVTLERTQVEGVVPSLAVIQRDGRNVVFTVANGSAKMNMVELGLAGKGVVQVKGLPNTAQVVVSGQQGLDEGTKVKIDTKPVAKA